MLRDLHTHTVFSDGKNSPEEMVISAIEKGLCEIGISDHSYTDFDTSYCIKKEKISEYKAEILRLKSKYSVKISVLCGIEQDYFSSEPTDGYDYVIGSVHYIFKNGEYVPMDESPLILKNAAEKFFNGDIYALAEEYFKTVSDVVRKTNADIIGHFDLITKFNEIAPLFDEKNPRYIKARNNALDELLKTGKPFEINTGAISRGYRTTPYPSAEAIEYIKKKGGKFILSSDAHSTETLCFKFPEIEKSFF